MNKLLSYYLVINVVLLILLQHPVTWQPSADGTKLVGHMVLKKSMDGLRPGDTMAVHGKGTLGKLAIL